MSATLAPPPVTPKACSLATGTMQYICDLVLKQSAIVLDPSKAYLIDSRLTPLARQHGFPGIEEFVATLRGKPYGEFHRQLVDAMTTNETSFFRDIHPFDALRKSVIPEVMARRATTRTLRIWSAACSTGQEPYTIAMLLREHFPALSSWNVRIHATDLSQQVLGRAREGVFSQQEVNRGLPAPLLVKHFVREGINWRLKPEVRNVVEFGELNLIGNWPQLPLFDIVFIRNVLIYFAPEVKTQILERVRRTLSPEGYLFLGGAETTLNLHDGFTRVQSDKAVFYQPKRGA